MDATNEFGMVVQVDVRTERVVEEILDCGAAVFVEGCACKKAIKTWTR
jgi:hypothetical protein